MSVGISNSDLLDLTKTTLQNLPDMEFEVALTYQEYNVVNQWFQSEKVQIESGTFIERNIILDTSGNAKHVRLYQKTPINVADVQQKVTAPWVQVQTHWSIERREALRNRAPARYIELLRSRRVDSTVNLADLLETRAWSSPQSSTDDLNPRGIPYWISKRQTSDDGQGFDGYTIRYAGGTTSTSKGGIDGSLSSSTKWRNYAATYSAINADFVKKLRRAFIATNFKSPVIAKDLKEGPASKYKLYIGIDNLTELEDMTSKQNDNFGSDLDKYKGNILFRGIPVLYTPQLDSDTDGPVYGVNHSKFFPVVLDGDWMREGDPMMDVEQHNVMTTFIDGSYQFFSINIREGGFVVHKVTAT